MGRIAFASGFDRKELMATFVLVHAAWGGGWEWRRVGDGLRTLGHHAFTPTLTGVGERSHLLSPAVGLETHIRDVLNVLQFEDLRDVVLCGHSSSGMVVTGVADAAPDRLGHLVYIDAPVPADGESLSDLLPAELVRRTRTLAESAGDGWRVPVPFGDGTEVGLPVSVASWYLPRLVDHPLRAFEDAIRLRGETPAARTFIYCTGHPMAGVFAPYAARARAEGWGYFELPTAHDPQIVDPGGLVVLLDRVGRALDAR